MLLVQVFTHRLNRHLLIGAVGNMILHGKVANVLTLTLLHQPFQVTRRVKSVKATRGITHAVNDIGFKTIGIINHGAHTILAL